MVKVKLTDFKDEMKKQIKEKEGEEDPLVWTEEQEERYWKLRKEREEKNYPKCNEKLGDDKE
ncbi:MAG: hypothetical protein KGD61_10955 [Candidatus Lokiarchaeota archaeon]|nr:hypothetical protein [Candidatus Lokiarchaeota archaeon]